MVTGSFPVTVAVVDANGCAGSRAYTLTVSASACDANGDGTVDWQDVAAVVNVLNNGGTCPLAGGCTILTLERVILAALGRGCTL